jgi:hypothetical protein
MIEGINYALDNIKAGYVAGWGAGSKADKLPHNTRADFQAGVRMVDELSFRQTLAVQHLLADNSIAHYGDAIQVPAAIRNVLRQRNASLEMVLSLVESDVATPHLPPYDE